MKTYTITFYYFDRSYHQDISAKSEDEAIDIFADMYKGEAKHITIISINTGE